jgi:hypothetical protein
MRRVGALGPQKSRRNEAMKTNLGQESAKIYQFPVRGVLSSNGRHSKIKITSDLSTLPVVETVFGNGWYHDAAIREENRNHKV